MTTMPPAPRRRPGEPNAEGAPVPQDLTTPELGTVDTAAAEGGGRGRGPGGPGGQGQGQGQGTQAPTQSERPIDGVGANANNADWGAADTAQLRLTPDAYTDGIGAVATDLPGARAVSNAVAASDDQPANTAGLSDMFWAWGQFLDHDLDLTEGGSEAMPIAIPRGDPSFDPAGSGVRTMNFTRSAVADGTGVTDARAPINENTSFIDASMVYGSSAAVTASLRTDDGKLLLGADGLLVADGSGFGLITGDIRAAENAGLTSMHVVFAREHNRIVDALADRFPTMTGDELFAAARARVEGLVQAITYREFLPHLVGRDAIDRYEGYDATVNPAVSVEFSTAAFRFGHTMLSGELERIDADGSVSEGGHLALRDAFFNTAVLADGGLEQVLRGLSVGTANELDTLVVEDVRSFLFGAPGAGGLDLPALNIQRGRDHGLASYNDMRAALGLERKTSFLDVTGGDVDTANRLAEIYTSVDQIDAWVGGLAEEAVNGGQVGELFATIIIDQFTRARDGDPFWSEATLSPQERRQIWSTSLSEVIARNTDTGPLQRDVFVAMTRVGGDTDANSLAGTEGRDFVFGAEGNDTLAGGAGDDELLGGAGADTFVFAPGGGRDLVRDFRPGDVVDLSAFTGVDSVSDLTIDRRGPCVAIDLGNGDVILLHGPQTVTADMVLFG
jgi:Ca2+-binding RTX toxin-like protein